MVDGKNGPTSDYAARPPGARRRNPEELYENH